MFENPVHQLHGAVESEFFEDVVLVCFHGAGADIQCFRYLFDAQSFGTKADDVEFPAGEDVQVGILGGGDGMDDYGDVFPEIVDSVADGVDGVHKGGDVGVFADESVDAEFDELEDILLVGVCGDDQHFEV